MSKPRSKVLPLLPLPKGTVLLPGTSIRIPVVDRADVAALLANIYSRALTPSANAPITVGCIPLNSPLLSADGKRLIEGREGRDGDKFDVEPGQATKKDLFQYGTVAKVSGVQGRRQGELALIVEGLGRISITRIIQEKPYFEAELAHHEEKTIPPTDDRGEELFASLKQLSREFLALVRLSSILPRSTAPPPLSPMLARRMELIIARKEIEDAGALADFMTNVIDCAHEDKLRILASLGVHERLERVIEVLQKQIADIQGNGRLMAVTTTKSKTPATTDLKRLQELVRARSMGQLPGSTGFPPGFPGFMGGGGQGPEEEGNELEELKKRLDDAKLPAEAQKVATRELHRLQKMNPAQAEYQVCRNYLENLVEIPWSKMTEDRLDAATLSRARKQLDDDHYGLEKIKKRLLEYLAVLKLKQAVNKDLDAQIKRLTQSDAVEDEADSDKQKLAQAKEAAPSEQEMKLLEKKRMIDRSPILLLVGPPGTGKTSLAKSIATALGRKFHRISLGGVRDEAEIRGHRRTYVAAMPGLIVGGLKKVGVANPVFLLDEIDKIGGSNFHGDPSAAMLEVLDPEQNHTFTDHYVNLSIDLSKVLFIATANSLDTIPPPLLDRMETIQLSGYTTLEKHHIAARHLLPKQIMSNGLSADDVELADGVLDKIIAAYTRESGVRNLERELSSVCRFKAVEYADSKDSSADSTAARPYSPRVLLSDLDAILGIERFEEELTERNARPGVVTGLVAFSSGGQGSILFIEVADMPGSGRVQLTGKLGDVLKESVEVALSWVRAHAWDLGLAADPAEDVMKSRAVHVHCPSGAVPKDGPSAGLAHTVALVSLFSGKAVPPTMAMTGEVSLRGRVLPVGGVKEKLIGALRAGVRKVLLPEGNRKDARELPEEVKRGIEIVHVAGIWEALREVWPDNRWEGARVYSRL